MNNYYVQKWCKSKSLAVAGAVMQVVGSVEALVSLINSSRDFKSSVPYRQDMPPEKWSKFYKKHRLVSQAISNLVFISNAVDPEDSPAFADKLLDLQSKVRRGAVDELASDKQLLTHYLTGDVDALANDGAIGELLSASLKPNELDVPDNIDKDVVLPPAIQFFFLVWGPCWFEYGIYPTLLYREARKGKQEYLEKLFRLDKRIYSDSTVLKHLARASISRNSGFDYLIKAMEKPPKKPGNKDLRKQIKIWAGGFVLYVSKSLCDKLPEIEAGLDETIPEPFQNLFEPVKYSDILELFDAYAKDATGEHDAQDEDFADDDPAAFKKRLQRAVDGWKFILPETNNGYARL